VPRPADDFITAVLAVVGDIPPGKVMAYSDVAAAIGSRAARAVGTVMSHYGTDEPWWRVVRASGHPPLDHETRALEYYRAEGTPLRWSASGVYRVDIADARHTP
jgi:alkylated DNA nucleotide flippase Atl1